VRSARTAAASTDTTTLCTPVTATAADTTHPAPHA
jgi:hypothetical protein